ncbi:toll/interleukin-1 receptor domain-containing protein [Kribbella sp. NPDC051952]|uniref:toll/interleukin-1 receptor domain-containing protein n=1 Tax=Kribbella sp. NPDC051952 TaxID=3154851 RepID=UPI00342FB138
MTHDLFIAYSRRNTRFVNRLVEDLKSHHIDVWLDTIELEVGDLFNLKIEEAIENSRYFCLAISPGALASYYVRQVEFESAFAILVRDKRESFILPILVQPVTSPLPARLRGRQYLDFTKRNCYSENMRKLARKVGLPSDSFSGSRWYKSLEISPLGQPTGIGSLTQIAPTGSSYCIYWEEGVVQRVDVLQNAKLINFKEFIYDAKGRVVENRMYSPDGSGGWHIEEDVWYYTYDPKTGRRSKKYMKYQGARSGRELTYNQDGRQIEENIITESGEPDASYGYARKLFEYTDNDAVIERWYDYDANLIKVVDHSQSESV